MDHLIMSYFEATPKDGTGEASGWNRVVDGIAKPPTGNKLLLGSNICMIVVSAARIYL